MNLPSILDIIGNTPLVALASLDRDCAASVAVKLESRNPCGSVKDRIAKAMIETAERDGLLLPGAAVSAPIPKTYFVRTISSGAPRPEPAGIAYALPLPK